MDQTRTERRAANELLFRSLNENIVRAAAQLGGELDSYLFICECSSDSCFEQVPITLDAYELVRSESRQFVVLPGHEDAELERPVNRTTAYLVVEKVGRAGELAEQHDPRH